MAGPWAFTSYFLRYVLLGLFAVVAVFSCFPMERSGRASPTHDGRITVPSILVLMLFSLLDVWAFASYFPPVNTIDAIFPLGAGNYYILQGGSSAVTNPFHTLGGNKLALDIVKLNLLGNRANGIAPRALSAYEIFGDTLYSPCDGNIVKVRDGLSDNPPGKPDTAHPEGNYIVLRCAGADIFMAHLRWGSIKVVRGEVVTVLQPLAEIGNSGDTLEPHLHIEATKDDMEAGLRFEGRFLSINSVITRDRKWHDDGGKPGVRKRGQPRLLRATHGKRYSPGGLPRHG